MVEGVIEGFYLYGNFQVSLFLLLVDVVLVVQDFLDGATEGRSGSGGNLIIKGDQLIHYQTVIAERYGDKIILNYSRYSLVTGKIQKAIKEKVPEDELVLIGKVPINYALSLKAKVEEQEAAKQ